jgi:hypothetical protein
VLRADVGAAAGGVDRLIEGLRPAAKLDLVHPLGNPRILLFDALEPAPGLHADRAHQFQFAAHRRQT